jgi:predicted PurR-regulated permease PerM
VTQQLTTPLTRYLVLAPTLLLSWALGRLGYPPLFRLAASVALGALLIVMVQRFQRRRISAHLRGEAAS